MNDLKLIILKSWYNTIYFINCIVKRYSISDLLFLALAIILLIYRCIIYDFSFIAYYSIIFMLFIFSVVSIYIRLYLWRNLAQSFASFILFTLNVVQLILYLFALRLLFILLYNNDIAHPIYLDNISRFSQYRYLLLCIISVFFILAFIIIKLGGYNIPSYSFFRYSLKDEVHKILYTWNNGMIGDLCIKIIDSLDSSFLFRILFFSIHFILFYVMRLFSTFLLFYCAVYHGDFRNFLYLTPLMFIIWLLSFFNHYFISFQQGCANYIRSLVMATPSNIDHRYLGIIKINPSQVSFELTQEALSKGYSSDDMYHLTKEWYIQIHLTTYFHIYLKMTNYLNYVNLLSQISIWLYITHIFFFLH
jgi:hypothetical protein